MKKLLTILGAILFTITAFAQDDIIIFGDSPDGDRLYDSSWGYKKAPSYLELAGNNDKFPVDTIHPFAGAHSLRLHWISKIGGDWGLAVASVGWRGLNLSQYDSLTWWINGPKAIVIDDLPDLALEDLANKKTPKVWLGDFFDGVDADSTTWQKVQVPLSEFKIGNTECDFTKIKTIFHFQRDVDEIAHMAWLDEIKAIKAGGIGPQPPTVPENVTAKGHAGRIDLKWKFDSSTDLAGFYIYRAGKKAGPYEKINPVVHTTHVYSDFFGLNAITYFYYITSVNIDFVESSPSDTVSETSVAMTTEELLTSVQQATFQYFYDYGHPVSGLTRERKGSGNTCTSGGTGFGLMALIVGAERNFVNRDSAATRVLKILAFLEDKTERFHGAWSHWINGSTGKAIPFSQKDDGGDIVETAYVVEGLLAVRQYFNRANTVEQEIRTRATRMWEAVEWDWYRRLPDSKVIYWHWSPNFGWEMNMPVRGFNESMIVYLLAIASPTHPVPASLYYDGWASSGYANGHSYYGIKQFVGSAYGGPLFFTHYSFLGFDPRDKSDKFCNYFENNRNTSLINRAYCMENPRNHAGYDSLVWGLTASDDPWGYLAHEPFNADNGTITPSAALSAMPYTPKESIATLKHFYYELGPRLWGEFGFKDAFNLDRDWFANSYIAIDQGPIIIMMENYRTQLLWNLFMANPEIIQMLQAIGWTFTSVDNPKKSEVLDFELGQNYPNPFNAQTMIHFSLPETDVVNLNIYNILGEKVLAFYEGKKVSAGKYQVKMDAAWLPSGIYFYQLQTSQVQKTMKMVLVR